MTNPNDYWRHQSPAAPHAPPHDRLTPGLPQQTNQPASSFDESSEPHQGYSGPVNPATLSAGLMLAGAFIVFIFSGPIFGSLYPMASATALAAGLVANSVLRVAAPSLDAASRLPISLLAAVVVFWPMSRLDHRLAATVLPYRLARHVARVFLIASFLTLTALNESGGQWLPRSIGQVQVLLADRRYLPVMVVAAVIAHLFLTRATRVRERWDNALQSLRLRPR